MLNDDELFEQSKVKGNDQEQDTNEEYSQIA
jgi:hypothetical protein